MHAAFVRLKNVKTVILILLWRIQLPRWRPHQRSFRSDGAGVADSQRPELACTLQSAAWLSQK